MFRISPDGAVTVIIDSSGDGAGNGLIAPTAIAVDDAGTVYVAGEVSTNVFKITPDAITELIDHTGDGMGHPMYLPHGIAVDCDGNVYVTGAVSDNAFRIAPSGVITQIIDATGDGAGRELEQPNGIAVDPAGNVFVGGAATHNVFRITPAAVITQVSSWVYFPRDLAAGCDGTVYIVRSLSDQALMHRPGGPGTLLITRFGAGGSRRLDRPEGIAVDATGRVYVSGANSNNVFRIVPDDAVRCAAPCCRSDLTGDAVVDFRDVLVVFGSWGPCDGCPADRTRDARVDFADVVVLLRDWGLCR